MPTNEGYVTVVDSRLAYLSCGDPAGVPLVLLHANNLDKRLWRDAARRFSRHRRVILYDMVGFGDSTPGGSLSQAGSLDCPDEEIPTDRVENELQSALDDRSADEDLEELLDHLGVSSVILLGLELGAEVAAAFAVANPERIEALVLVSPSLPDFLPFSDEWLEWVEEKAMPQAEDMNIMDDTVWERMASQQDPAPMIEILMSATSFAPRDAESRRTIEEIMRENTSSFLAPQARTGVPGGHSSEPVAKRLTGYTRPTLLVAGEQDEQEILENVQRLRTRIPNSRIEIIPDAGRFVHLDNPKCFYSAVLRFLSFIRD